ncbi:hypothetical protein NKI32_28265 [Mesorhizobium sp. M0761]|uniref:hypothetical protein n=1 Tax=Mesorhizobium sp. M0761 TaxID=2956994 RepID=UPI00333CFB47
MTFIEQAYYPRRSEVKVGVYFLVAYLGASVAAKADTFDYRCKFGVKTYSLKVNTEANTLEWRGQTYRIVKSSSDSDYSVCANYGWHVEGDGTSFDFCTATQGYADIQKDGEIQVQCDMKR